MPRLRIRSALSRAALARGRLGATLALAAVVSLHLAGSLPFQETLRMFTFQLYQTSAPRERLSTPVIVVEIDAPALEKLGAWPWPRNLTALLLNRIWRMQPAAVGLDIEMPEADRFSACEIARYVPGIDAPLVRRVCALPGNDSALAESLRRGKAVLSVRGRDGASDEALRVPPVRVVGNGSGDTMRSFEAASTSLPELHAAAGVALRNVDTHYGVVRKVPMIAKVGESVVPSLSLEMLRLATRSPELEIRTEPGRIAGVAVRGSYAPTQDDGSLWVHFGPRDRVRSVSAAQVLDGSLDAKALRNKIVLVGVSGPGTGDLHTTTLGERVPAVEVHAQVLESIVDGTTLLRPHWALWLEGALMLVVGLSISWGFPHMRARVVLPIMAATIALLWFGGVAAYTRAHLLFDVASPMSIFVMMFAFMLADSLVREELRRKWLADQLAREEVQRRSLEHDLASQREHAARARGEMEAANRIQTGMLPDAQALFASEGRLDIAARMEPAKHVGGDLYDCFMLDDHHAFFTIGDVCGKGVPAALFMAISKTLCKSLVLRDDPDQSDPGALMRQANREISRDNPEMLFLTAFIGVLDLRNGELRYCNAGHDNPLVFAPGSLPIELDGPKGPPICIIDDFEYRTNRRQLAPVEMVCMFTDGVTEALDSAGEMYGKDRLLAVLRRHGTHGASAQQVLDAVCTSVHGFATGVDPSDDLTVVVMRWTSS